MTQLIDALERVVQDSSLHYADRAQLAAMGFEDDARAALLDSHTTQLEKLLDASSNRCCLIVTPDNWESGQISTPIELLERVGEDSPS